MKKLLCGCFLVLAGFLVSPALGQVGNFPNPLVLVENKDVQKELKLSDEQLKKIAELSRKQMEGLKGLGVQDGEKREKVLDASRKGLDELLSAEQGKRLKQLEVQQRGPSVFLEAKYAKGLGITTQQQDAVVKALEGLRPRWIAIIQAAKGNQPEIQQKVSELNRTLMPDILKGLTAEQQTRWKDLTGPAFAGVFPAPEPRAVFPNLRPQPVLEWHMNNFAAAQAEARLTGKPIFVTFRCEA
jgi:hypothetical protein